MHLSWEEGWDGGEYRDEGERERREGAIRELQKIITLKDYDVLRGTPHDPIGTLRGVTRDVARPSEAFGECPKEDYDELQGTRRVQIRRDSGL